MTFTKIEEHKMKINQYKVKLSNHASVLVRAYTVKGAGRQVWDDIRRGFRYGWERKDFLKDAHVERL